MNVAIEFQTLATSFSSGKYGLLDGSTYPSGWVVTHSSDVTPESKIDTNAGTTADSGLGRPVPDSVNQVEVAYDLRRCENP